MRYFFDLTTSIRWIEQPVGIVRVERELASRATQALSGNVGFCAYSKERGAFFEVDAEAAAAVLAGDLQSPARSRALAAAGGQSRTGPLGAVRNTLLARPRLYQLVQALRGRRYSLAAVREARDRALGARDPATGLKVLARDMLLSLPPVYIALQRLRGRRYSREDVARAWQAEKVARPNSTLDARILLRDWLIERPRLYRFVQRFRGHNLGPEEVAQIRARLTPGALPLSPDVTVISGGLDWEDKDLRAIYHLKRSTGFRYATILCDLIPLKFPHFVVPAYVDLLNEYFGELFWVADYCLCISETTKRDVLEHLERSGAPVPAISHFPLGSDLPRGSAPVEFPFELQGKRYALYVSTIEPRKNHRIVYQAWEHAISRGSIDPATCRLVFVGREGWNTADLLQEMDNNSLTRDSILRMKDVPDALLAELYRRAEFAVFPSYYEGYGLPLAEALAAGLPCVVTPTGALQEIGGDLVVYREPWDLPNWSGVMAAFFNEPALLAKQKEGVVTSYRPVTWDQAAGEFFRRLEALVDS